jgi:hypothetical protein
VADLVYLLTGALAFALMALFAHAIAVLIRQDDEKGSGR